MGVDVVCDECGDPILADSAYIADFFGGVVCEDCAETLADAEEEAERG